MATIKSYTDINQSRKLTKILHFESADMIWANDNDVIVVPYDMATRENVLHDFIPCWSLAALLGVLPMITKDEDTANPFIAKASDNEYYVVYATLTKEIDSSDIYDNPVDACVEMIEKLHELNLL